VRALLQSGIVAVSTSLLLALGAVPSFARCHVPTFSAKTHAAGDRAARRYARERRREFRHDLMGYRQGPKLPRLTRKERREIADERASRLQFALNPNRLLIRRLLRDRSRTVRNSVDLIGFALAPLEVRTVDFEDRFQDSTARVDEYTARCGRRHYGGAYFVYRRARPQLLVVNVTAHVDRYLDALEAHFRYQKLLRVRRVRFSEIALQRVQNRVDADWDRGWLARRKLDISSTGLDDEQNAVIVSLSNPSRRAARILRRRYGPAVRMDPNPETLVALSR
jgi:hypothetical protein